ncbi:MAG TPA: hypothetical protein PLU53_06505 [Bacteroidia bacterium]|nr:hypothetical protein [Bacteroidia bacterium]
MKIHRLPFLPITLFFYTTAAAQLPDTDIFLVDLKNENGKISCGIPENLTRRPGYDNQPCFSEDGKSLYYVRVEDTTQSDIYSVNLSTKKSERITNTKESEYSPFFSPNDKSLTVVRVDRDSGQRAYRLPFNSISSATLIPGTDSIGYFCWLNDSLLAMFILGPSNTLQVLNTKTLVRTLIASDVGRCLKLSPDKQEMLFVIKGNETEWFIYSLNVESLKTERMIRTIPGNEDFAILPDKTLLLGSDGKLFSWKAGLPESWTELADFTSTLHSFYRISVNAKGTRLALVAFTGKKP